MNLRNMGSLRTLVLMDGMRVIPTINQNQADVDASIVPQLLLTRADVVTGGVSAVYGSDAVSGVINFITDRNFNGIKVQANTGISNYNDDRIWDVGVAAGSRFANDRGHVEFSFQHHEDDGLTNRLKASDRAFYAANTGVAGAGTAANPFFNIPDMRLSNVTFGGLIIAAGAATDSALQGLTFTPQGALAPFVHGQVPVAGGTLAPFGTVAATSLASANIESGGDGGWFPSSSLKHGIEFDQAFGRFDYELSDTIHAYAQASWSKVFTFNQFRSPVFQSATGNLRFSYANPFLSTVQQPYQAIFAANPTRSFTMNEILLNDPRSEQDTESYMAFAGLDGTFAGDFKWNVNFGKSQSVIRADDLFNIDRGRLFAALDAIRAPNGQIICRASQTNAAYAGCVPLNIFGQGAASAAALGSLYEKTFNENRTRMDTVNGALTGAPFSTWAGPVNMALSGEWRNTRWDVNTNTDPAQFANCAGISFNCTQGTTLRWVGNTMAPVALVSQKVTEIAYEVEVPLLRDTTLAQSLNVTGAIRQTHYSTSGNATTWKVGGDWRINDTLRFRATRSRDIRAPNLFELYTSTQINSGITARDPLTNTTFGFANTQGGNLNLTSERADTLTLGGVLTPTFIPGFSLSVDYYKIKVDDVIFLLQGFSVGVLNACAASAGANPSCVLVNRANWTDTNPLTNPIRATTSTYLNIAQQNTWGTDIEASYRTDLFGQPLSIRALAAYQPKLVYDQGPAGVLSIAGAYNAGTNRLGASPKWKFTGIVAYEVTDNINVTVMQRWRSGLDAIYDPAVVVKESRLPSLGYTTLNVSFHQKTRLGDTELYFNASNLFNKFPTVYYTNQVTQPGTQPFIPEGDDPIGRYFTVGLRLRR
jgi:iron complex outermembrane recepter protein